MLGFLLPAGYLVREVIVRGLLVGFDPSLVRHALTTVVLAGDRDRDRAGARLFGGRGAALRASIR